MLGYRNLEKIASRILHTTQNETYPTLTLTLSIEPLYFEISGINRESAEKSTNCDCAYCPSYYSIVVRP